MIRHIPVSVFEGKNEVYFQSDTGFFARLANTVSYDNPSSLWEEETSDEETFIRPHINESNARLTTPWQHSFDEDAVAEGVLELIEVSDDELYLVGVSNAVPAYSPFYFFDTETETVYSVHYAFAPTDFDGDDVLDFDAQESVVTVENQSTGHSRPLDHDSVVDKLGGRYKYALPLRVP